MSKLTKPSVSMLPVDDLIKTLARDGGIDTELFAGFLEKTGTAANTALVGHASGAAVHANNTAVVYNVSAGPHSRDTVRNAMYLDDLPASAYVNQETISGMGKAQEVGIKEILDLRDELYQIKNDLVKTGISTDTAHYMGFSDSFRPNAVKYRAGVSSSVVAITQNSFTAEHATEFQVGDYIALVKENSVETPVIVQVTGVNTPEVSFVTNVTPTKNEQDIVNAYHTLGEYFNGTFSFSQIEENPLGLENNIEVVDGRNGTIWHNLSAPATGIGYTFGVNDHLASDKGGALTRVRIRAHKHGGESTGALRCSIISLDGNNILAFKDDNSPTSNAMINGDSVVGCVEIGTGTGIYEFNFAHNSNQTILEDGKEYAVVISTVGSEHSSVNRWSVLFVNNDMQPNNIIYTLSNGTMALSGLTQTNELYHVIYARKILHANVMPNQMGLYSASFDLPQGKKTDFARINLRVSREGLFRAVTSGALNAGSAITFTSESADYPSNVLTDAASIADDPFVIGQYPRDISGTSGNSITLKDKGLYIDPDKITPVYRVGHKINLRPYHKNELTGVVTYGPGIIKPVLTAVMPDENKRNRLSSDRLLFEAPVSAITVGLEEKAANGFDLQIVWHRATSMTGGSDVYGAIHDLVATVGQAVSE